VGTLVSRGIEAGKYNVIERMNRREGKVMAESEIFEES